MVKQYPLGWEHAPSMALEDFLVSSSNQYAYNAIAHVDQWPHPALCIFGPKDSGKTHLSHAFARLFQRPVFITPDMSFDQVKDHDAWIIEDIDQTQYHEDMIFHLYNWSKENNRKLLLTAQKPPSQWTVKLPDLKSRFGLMDVQEISEPDDALLELIYYKLFSDRQIMVDPSLVKYLLLHVERSFSAATNIVIHLDREALARKCKVSRHLAIEVLRG